MRTSLHKAALCVALLGLAACGATSHTLVVSINPPEASLYINGEKVGNGDKRPRTFSFEKEKRYYLQAVHPDFKPMLEIHDEASLRRLVNANLPLKMTLSSR